MKPLTQNGPSDSGYDVELNCVQEMMDFIMSLEQEIDSAVVGDRMALARAYQKMPALLMRVQVLHYLLGQELKGAGGYAD